MVLLCAHAQCLYSLEGLRGFETPQNDGDTHAWKWWENFEGGVVACRRRHHPETGVRGKEARSVLCSVCVSDSSVQRRRIIIIYIYI